MMAAIAADDASTHLGTCLTCNKEMVPIQYELTARDCKVKFCSIPCFAEFRRNYKGICIFCKNLVPESSMHNSFCTNMCKVVYDMGVNPSRRHDDPVLTKIYAGEKDLLYMQRYPDDNTPAIDWKAYLELTHSVSAPAKCFKQALKPPVNNFTIDMRLKTNDPRRNSCACAATVVAIQGPRICLRLLSIYNSGSDHETWCLVDSPLIQHMGRTSDEFQAARDFRSRASTLPKCQRSTIRIAADAPKTIFLSEPPAPSKNLFKVGQKLEAVDMKTPEMIRCATVKAIKDDEILLTFDGWQSALDYWCHYQSRDIFPVDWYNTPVAAPVMLHFQRNCNGGPWINRAKLPAKIMAPTYKTMAKLCLQTILNANAGKKQLVKILYGSDTLRNSVWYGRRFILNKMSPVLVADQESLQQFVRFMCILLRGCPNLISLERKPVLCVHCSGSN